MDYNAGWRKCSTCDKQFIPDMYYDNLLYFCGECTNRCEQSTFKQPHTTQANLSYFYDKFPYVDTPVTSQTTQIPLSNVRIAYTNACTSANVTYQTIQTVSTYNSDCINENTSPTVILQTTQDKIDHETISQKSYATERLLKEHKEMPDTDRRYPCTKPKCNKTFKTKQSLQTHISKMHREKLFSCDICPKSFVYESLLNEHKESHNTDRPYLCTESDCNKSFKTKQSLRTHISKMHRGKLFSCDMCPKSYVSERLLNQHKATHNPEKPYLLPYYYL